MTDIEPIIIAIDGYSSCGKSTLAKSVAAALSYKHIDSGAMYRAVCLYCLDNNISVLDSAKVISVLPKIRIDFTCILGQNRTILNGVDVEDQIRTMRVNAQVSEVSTIPEVRAKLVKLQRDLGAKKGIVMEGRDITTVVYPNAEIKIFLTADNVVRVKRRFQELLEKGLNPDVAEVRKNLTHRDNIDSNRSHSPLTIDKDAFLLDNTFLTKEDQVEVILQYKKYLASIEQQETDQNLS